MGIGSSIATSSRKYQPNGELTHPAKPPKGREIEIEDNSDEDAELASVSSFRPSTPAAHEDAKAFTLDGASPRSRGSNNHHGNRHSYHDNPEPGYHGNQHSYHDNPEPRYHGNRHSYHGSIERGYRAVNGAYDRYSVRDPSYRAVASYAGSSSTGSRTMRDVREYLICNPQLLAGKKNKKALHPRETDLYGFSNDHKQMKTKQSVYLGLINPPVIYGAGAIPNERQLKVDQKLYLNLVYPTMNARAHHNQAMRSRPPLKQDSRGMIVVRKDDYMQQPNGYVSQRKALPEMEVSRVNHKHKSRAPESTRQENPDQRYEVSLSHTAPPRIRNGTHSLPKTTHKRKTNDYVDPSPPLTSQSVKSERQKARSGLLNGAKPENLLGKGTVEQQRDDEVVFTFNVDDLHLRKKSEVARFEHDRDTGQVVPLYLRKSLAYSPKYENSEDLLSSPL